MTAIETAYRAAALRALNADRFAWGTPGLSREAHVAALRASAEAHAEKQRLRTLLTCEQLGLRPPKA